MSIRKGSTSLNDFQYTYSKDGNILTETDSVNNTNKTYTYDNVGQLIKEVQTGAVNKTYSYSYDSIGNRTKKVESGITTSYTYDANNQLTSESTKYSSYTKNTAYDYDNNGNMLSKTVTQTNSAATLSYGYSYNMHNQLTTYISPTANAVYEYNANGLRKSKKLPSSITYFGWSGDKMTAETKGSMTNVYGYGTDGIAVGRINGDVETYIKNAHGDVVSTYGNELPRRRYRYEAFGTAVSTSNATGNPFRYAGEYYDEESGMIYLRARYYAPSLGRFINEDPIKDGWNWHTYCENNPVNRVDPTGLEYGKLRDFVMDYYEAFGADTNIQLCSSDKGDFAYVTLGEYERAFYYDGTIIERTYDPETGDLIEEQSIKIGDNINGSLYMQRSAFVSAMGMTKDGTATVIVSEPIRVSRELAIANFATYINDATSDGNDIKDVLSILRVHPSIASIAKGFTTTYSVINNMSNGNVLASGMYRAESVIVKSPVYSWYSYKVNTLYGIDKSTSSYQWFFKCAYAWDWFPGGE